MQDGGEQNGNTPSVPLTDKRKWTDEEIAFLKKHYVKDGRQFVAEHLHRSTTCVAGKARHIGIRREPHRAWSPFEDNYVRRNFGKKPASSMARSLRRTLHAVHARAVFLGLSGERDRAYTPEERAFIKQQYESGVSATEIARQMGRPETSIRTRVNRWGLTSGRPWSKKDETFLRKHVHIWTVAEIAEKLGRTESAVRHYICRHGLSKRAPDEPITAPSTRGT